MDASEGTATQIASAVRARDLSASEAVAASLGRIARLNPRVNAFTDVVRRAYNEDGRKRIIEMMWDIAFADGVLHEFEDNMVWRVAEILGVPPTQRVLIRKKVAAARGVDIAGISE